MAVVRDESAAISGALTLLFYAKKVHLISDKLQASERLLHQLEASEIRVHSGKKAVKIIGNEKVKGFFAAGDICGPPWQMAKAVGEGCMAGLTAARYVKKNR